MDSIETKSPSESDMGNAKKMLNIFFEPTSVFEQLKIKPNWFLPWLVLILVSLITMQVTWQQTMEAQMERVRDRPGITEEQIEEIEKQMGDTEGWGVNRIVATVFAPIAILVAFLVVAGALYFMGSVLGGGNATYKQNLAIYSYSSLIGCLGAIVNAILVNIKGTLEISLAPTLFLPASMSESFIYNFLGHFEFFTIWIYILVSIGFSIIYDFSRAKSFISVGVLWLIWILITTALSNIFGGFFGV
ncbi:MAG: hypothetical protein GF315_07930 [candidate division Zixibacteria bacterium]|nr:hypothetical protein [candidate division Zixibacteria bacterium]